MNIFWLLLLLGGCAEIFDLVEITSLLHVIVMLEEKNIENV